MDVHANDWSELAGRLANNYGEAFEPDRRKELRPKLVRILTRELGDVERDHVVASLDDVLRRTKVTIDWHRFLCIILSSLPGTWTKLTNNPGFNASTMLLLLDGTVMCQQEGGLNWKKLTPDSSGSYRQRHLERPRADALDAPLLRVSRPQRRSRLRLRR